MFTPQAATRAVPRVSIRSWLRKRYRGPWPPVGWVRFGGLRRTRPISQVFGFDRGLPIDRHYIESFLQAHCQDVRGRVLEVADSDYTVRFGGDRVLRSDVLDLTPTPRSTIVADLQVPDSLPADTFDCIILTQVLQLIYDIRTAIRNSYRALKPGGVLLVTLPGICRICRDEEGRWGDCWRLTGRAARLLFEEQFPAGSVSVATYGNVLAATGFLYGLAVAELKRDELDAQDPDFELVVSVRAVKPGTS